MGRELVKEFVVELYLARSNASAVGSHGESARRAATELSEEGTHVRYVRSIFVPEDETCFLLYEADSEAAVREAAARAALPFDRVSEAVGEQERGGP